MQEGFSLLRIDCKIQVDGLIHRSRGSNWLVQGFTASKTDCPGEQVQVSHSLNLKEYQNRGSGSSCAAFDVHFQHHAVAAVKMSAWTNNGDCVDGVSNAVGCEGSEWTSYLNS